MEKWHLAVDIGASSGRHILGRVVDGRMELKEVYRFPNQLIEKDGHLCWDIDSLAESVIKGIEECGKQGYHPVTMGIDTWAVDFVLLNDKDERIGDAVAYRDSRTEGIKDELEEKGILSFEELYDRTGIQYQAFNTVYQLCALKKEHPEYLEQAETFLMIPDYLNFLLTGVKVNEYTNASSTALLNAELKTWDTEIMKKLGLPEKIFRPVQTPGTVVGKFSNAIKERVGFDCMVTLPATHDTGSAYVAVPAENDTSIFLSSGTWSLLGVENASPVTSAESRWANFTNEGGYNYRFRYLKNIMGLWMIQNVRKEQMKRTGGDVSFPDLIAAAQSEKDFPSVLNVDEERFLAPKSMIDEVTQACADTNQQVPENIGQVMQCIYNSLSDDYARAIKKLEWLTGKTFTDINIVGGGSQDNYLNQMTANATGLTVHAGPTEGTALGNLIVQFIREGEYYSLEDARKAIRNSFEIRDIKPNQ